MSTHLVFVTCDTAATTIDVSSASFFRIAWERGSNWSRDGTFILDDTQSRPATNAYLIVRSLPALKQHIKLP